MADPIDVLKEFFDSYANEINYSIQLTDALTELERRRRVEKRLETWLKVPWHKVDYYRINKHNEHTVCLSTRYPTGGSWTGGACKGPDYWTAVDKALDAAGAPK